MPVPNKGYNIIKYLLIQQNLSYLNIKHDFLPWLWTVT